jgi:hypothetical protein
VRGGYGRINVSVIAAGNTSNMLAGRGVLEG